MDYKTRSDLYFATCTFDEFMSEWDGGDYSNIPFIFNFGSLWIFQPRKECVYEIHIRDYEKHETEIKKIIRDGLKELKERYGNLKQDEFTN